MKLFKLDAAQLKRIYNERLIFDFPENEQKPLDIIEEAIAKDIYECLGLMDEDNIIGYAFLAKKNKNYLLDFLAVYPEKRNSGVGGKILQLLAEYLEDADNVVLEIEDPDMTDDSEEKKLQTRRKGFYLRNGCRDTGLRIACFGVPFQLLFLGKNKTDNLDEIKETYLGFYKMIFSQEMLENNISDFSHVDTKSLI